MKHHREEKCERVYFCVRITHSVYRVFTQTRKNFKIDDNEYFYESMLHIWVWTA